jgi:hypothetical protein
VICCCSNIAALIKTYKEMHVFHFGGPNTETFSICAEARDALNLINFLNVVSSPNAHD